MTEANTASENTVREESSAPVRTNFELLSDDTFLNDTINNTEEVKVGDAILARGSANGRPFVPGVPIGEVTAVDNSASAITQTADVKFYTNFSTLGVVAVVISSPAADPRDSLVPAKPRPTPIPTVTVTATPSPSPSSKG